MSKSLTTTVSSRIAVPGLAQMRRAPTHPGEIFREEYRVPSGLTSVEVSKRLGISNNRLNEVELGKRGVTPETAVLFAAITGTSAEFWCNLQMNYDLWHALHDPAIGKQAKTIKRFEYPTAPTS
jgi:antitoxin HigA-1